jgi:hypothetical protein
MDRSYPRNAQHTLRIRAMILSDDVSDDDSIDDGTESGEDYVEPVAYREGVLGGSNPPRSSEVLTKLSRIPSSVKNTSVTV